MRETHSPQTSPKTGRAENTCTCGTGAGTCTCGTGAGKSASAVSVTRVTEQLILIREKIAALEAWKRSTELDLKEIRDVVSQVKLLMSLSIGGGGLSILTLIITLILLVTGNK